VVTIGVAANVAGVAVDTASVFANEADLNLANNNATASVTVLAAPQVRFSSVYLNANHQFQLTLTGQPNLSYIVQATTNLTTGNWTAISTNTAASNGSFQFIDTNSPGLPSRFYRVMAQ
jgi:hypothetical protein